MSTPLWNGFVYEQHQVAGIRWMKEREDVSSHRGGLLCDEMGLGKTIQMIGLLKETGLKSNLFFGPLPVLEQWRSTATKAGINCWIAKSGAWEPPSKVSLRAPNLYLVNYEAAIKNPDMFDRPWDRIICDEAHRMANKGASWTLIKEIKCSIHWFLTATPIVNKVSDVNALFEMLGLSYSPSIVQTYALARSMEAMRPILPNLPKKEIQMTHILDFDTEDEADFYRGIQGDIKRRFRALADEGGGAALDKLKLIMRLRQISLHPQIYIEGRRKALGPTLYTRPDWIDPSTKFQGIRDLVEKDSEPKKWIVFCHFHKEMELLKEFLGFSDKIDNIWLYHGGLSAGQRTAVLEQTAKPNGGKHEILLIQLQSGGTGLNLQHFQSIVFSGPWWTAALMDQAIGRAVRIGQKAQVVVHHMILKEEQGLNIDRLMKNKAEKKGKLCMEFLEAANHTV